MKRTEKIISSALALAMSASLFAVSPMQVMAADDLTPIPLYEDFNDWTSLDDELPADGEGQHTWERWGKTTEFTGAINAKTGTDDKYVTLTTSWAGIGVDFPTVSSGVYKIKASMLLSGTDNARGAFMLGNSTTIIPVQLHVTETAATVRVATAKGTGPDKSTDETHPPVGTFDPSKWVDAEVIVDMDRGFMSMVLKQDGTEIAHKYLTDISDLDGLQVVGFKKLGADSTFSVDNVSIEEVTSLDGIPVYAEDFNGTATFAHLTTGAKLFPTTDTTNGSITDDKTFSLPTEWKHASITFKNGDGTGLNGYYTINFKVKSAGTAEVRLDNDSKMPEVPLFATGSGKLWVGEAYISSDDVDGFYTTDGTGNTSVTPVGTYDTSKWLEVEAVVDTVNALVSTKVTQDGQVIANFPIRGVPGIDDGQGIRYLRFRNLSGNAMEIDDVKVVHGGEFASTTVMAEEDFSDFNDDITKNRVGGWLEGIAGAKQNYYVHTDNTGNKMIKLYPYKDTETDKNVAAGITFTTNSYIDRGDVTIDFDAMFEGGNFLCDLIQASTESTSNYDGTTAIRTIGGTSTVTTQYHTGTGPALEQKFELNSWYHYKVVVHPKKSAYDLIMTDAEGTLVNEKYDIPMNYGSSQNIPQTTFKAVRFRLWNNDNTAYIDNFKMTYDLERPKLDKSKVSMLDSQGNVIDDILNDVDPALQSITLDFGADLAAAPEATLTDADGNAVSYTGTVDGTKFVMDIGSVLENNKKYTLFIPADTKSTNGNEMGEAFTMEFTTGEVKATIELVNVTDADGNVVSAIGDIAANDVITVNTTAVNTTSSDDDLTWIMAYYNGNGLNDIDMYPTTTVVSGASLTTMPTFTVKDLTDVSKIKIFLWNTLSEMIPHDEAIELELVIE